MNDNYKGVQCTSCPDTGNKCYLRTAVSLLSKNVTGYFEMHNRLTSASGVSF